MSEKTNEDSATKRRIKALRQSFFPINEQDSALKRFGKNIGFVSFMVLIGVVTIILVTVISVVL